MRVLGVIRLSRETEASTSVERQKQIIEAWAMANGHEIVGWAIDLGISGSVDPWERPNLGAWLNGERGPFDIVAVWRLDRLSRRVLHFSRLLYWARESGRTLVSVTEGWDLSTPMGRLLAQLIATLAEGELDAIKERTKGSYDHLVKVGRHRGGFVPYGYRPAPNPKGNGYVLEVDPDTSSIIRDVARRVIDGASINSMVVDLNSRGVMTSLDVQRVRADKKPKGYAWRVGNLSALLRSDTLRGFVATDDGAPVVGEDGKRVRRAKPILSDREWRQLQQEIGDRSAGRKPRPRTNAAMLRQVAFCAVCEPARPMYINPGRGGLYYRCSAKSIGGLTCANGSVEAAWLENRVADKFLASVGHFEVVRRVFIPGESHAEEVTETTAALGRLVEQLEKVPTGGAAAAAVLARMAEHEQHLETLYGLPELPDRWVDEPTGMTFAAMWETDPGGRGDVLRTAGVRALVQRAPGQRRIPPAVAITLGVFGDEEEQRMREITAEETLA